MLLLYPALPPTTLLLQVRRLAAVSRYCCRSVALLLWLATAAGPSPCCCVSPMLQVRRLAAVHCAGLGAAQSSRKSGWTATLGTWAAPFWLGTDAICP